MVGKMEPGTCSNTAGLRTASACKAGELEITASGAPEEELPAPQHVAEAAKILHFPRLRTRTLHLHRGGDVVVYEREDGRSEVYDFTAHDDSAALHATLPKFDAACRFAERLRCRLNGGAA